MPRIEPVDSQSAGGKARQLLADVQAEWGMTPNVLLTLANAPAALEAYLGFSNALAGGVLSAELREQIALSVAQANECEYCLAAHSGIGKSLGLSAEAIADARRGTSPDRKVEAVLHFAQEMVARRGWVSEEGLLRARGAGCTDQEIVEIIANVAVSILTNYFNHVAETELDFPRAPPLADV